MPAMKRNVVSMRKANEREQARLGSDLAKVDAHTITDAEYEEIPELDDAWFEHARVVRSGVAQEAVSIPLDRDLLARLEATGPGWQARVNEILREWAEANLAAM